MIIINLLSFFLDGIISLFIDKNSIFIPLFSIMSLIVCYPLLKNKRKIIIIGTILGLLYDIVYTQKLFTNTIIFFVISLLVLYYFRYLRFNTFNSTLLSIIIIIFYRCLSYFTFILFSDAILNIKLLFRSIYSSFIFNLLYVFSFNCVYYLLKIQDKKPDKYIFK